MKHVNYTDIAAEEVGQGASGAKIRWLIRDGDGAKVFHMRHFELEPISVGIVAATPRDASSARSEEEGVSRYADDERHSNATHIEASLRVAAAAGRLLCRSSSTYLWISHRRRSLHPARGRSQRRSRGLLK